MRTIRFRWGLLARGRTCMGCGRRRRLRWYSDTSCCSFDCLQAALFRLSLDPMRFERPRGPRILP